MAKFNPDWWYQAADIIERASEDFERSTADGLAPPTPTDGGSSVDETIVSETDAIARPWYHLLGGVPARMASDVSKIRATGKNYKEAEDINIEIIDRYWEST